MDKYVKLIIDNSATSDSGDAATEIVFQTKADARKWVTEYEAVSKQKLVWTVQEVNEYELNRNSRFVFSAFSGVTAEDILTLCSEKNAKKYDIKSFMVGKSKKSFFRKRKTRVVVYFASREKRDIFQQYAWLVLIRRHGKELR